MKKYYGVIWDCVEECVVARTRNKVNYRDARIAAEKLCKLKFGCGNERYKIGDTMVVDEWKIKVTIIPTFANPGNENHDQTKNLR